MVLMRRKHHILSMARQWLRYAGALVRVALSVVLLGACTQASAERQAVIEMQAGNRFAPASMTVPVGMTVIWHNGDC